MIHVSATPWAHMVFDLAAWVSGLALGASLNRWRLGSVSPSRIPRIKGGYFVALIAGAIPGAWLAGSLVSLNGANPALSHSVVGALIGAIAGVELYKASRRVNVSTGGVFVGPFALGLVVGRIGCLMSGLADGTYGVATSLPWAVDLGDGIGRHPVQLYESATMALFLAAYLRGLERRDAWAMQRGFYGLCIWYGAQRFAWEFLKPYPTLVGPLNLFHLMCGGLVAYGWVYSRRGQRQLAQERAVSISGADHESV